MGFLKKSSAPSELPNLAIDGISPRDNSTTDELNRDVSVKKTEPVISAPVATQPLPVLEDIPAQPIAPKPIAQPSVAPVTEEPKKEVAGEDYLEVSHDEAAGKLIHADIKKVINENVLGDGSRFKKESFFDEVLEDINGGIADVGKLEDWYEKKFAGEDVVSNMKEYWEGNKADIIIESFGAEYKREINDKVKVLRELEEDWREIYFRLVKKEEEMKKEERELKETLSEFVNLCKKRKHGAEEKVE
jgi:hypothetical protein